MTTNPNPTHLDSPASATSASSFLLPQASGLRSGGAEVSFDPVAFNAALQRFAADHSWGNEQPAAGASAGACGIQKGAS